MAKHIQTIIDNFTYRKLWYICGKLNITMYELLKNYINDFVKKNIDLIPKDILSKIENGYRINGYKQHDN